MDDITVLAAQIADTAHDGQLDKAGQPYITHPRRVARTAGLLAQHPRSPVRPDEAAAAALLHDVIEDSPVTVEALLAAGVPRPVVDAVARLTREPVISKPAYLEGIMANPLAIVVKLADTLDNCDPARLAMLDPSTADRLRAKYQPLIAALTRAWVQQLDPRPHGHQPIRTAPNGRAPGRDAGGLPAR